MPAQEIISRQDHAWGAVPALQGIVGDEGLLNWVQLAVAREALDGHDVGASDRLDVHGAGSNGAMVHKDGASTALGDAAAVFRAGEPQVGSKDPKQGPVGGHAYLHGLAVQAE